MNNEIVFSDKNNSNLIASLLKKKEIRPLTRGVYTRNMQDYLREITKNKWLEITNHLYPNHCLAFRTAIELKVSPKNKIYLTGNRANKSD